MPLNNWTKLKGVTDIGKTLLTTELENNLKVFFDWGLLGIGGWYDVTGIPHTGPYGGDYSKFRMVSDPNYTDGQVWESIRKDWVWESGIEYSGVERPSQVTGISIGGVSYGTGDATYAHHYNYPLGRVIFDTAISTTSTVQGKYSYRWSQIYRAVDSHWFKQIQAGTLRPDDAQFTLDGSGAWDILSHNRIQMPCIVIETVPLRYYTPYELGNGTLIAHQDIRFHVYAGTAWERNQLIDIISYQDDKNIYMYDTDDVIAKGNYPLDSRGMLRPSPQMYPQYVSSTGDGGSRNKTLKFTNTVISEIQTHDPRLYEGIVTTTAEVYVGVV